jgi:predicted RNA-binding Zn-ribbon protein involved in translation (DUF1610 family)
MLRDGRSRPPGASMTHVYYSCPTCKSENLERCFAVSKELWGYSWHCLDCGWRGVSADRFVDRDAFEDERPVERESFTDWPNGQGVYD